MRLLCGLGFGFFSMAYWLEYLYTNFLHGVWRALEHLA